MQPDGQSSERAFEITFIHSLNFDTQPFVYNNKTQFMVSFDDAKSFSMSNQYCHPLRRTQFFQIATKGKYIKSTCLAGFSMWETGGDSHDILLDAINSAMYSSTY